ncbi:hypothetical protein BDK51DRAFT_29673 [Blyttiomyces helicus]|uniref:RGS domain-containing protein n=1 Tax=Blyttiomyces helicus TaxID=388810 RepID=A0A4P9WU97_9FUNG|nr:hypothetical protein BDK51DRAFT_29673 [Blyttiomyces helicus]|eukprot:RKO94646.1 hypothetical protein BDK51DRAFT_29673 [Blyttiomyces helicus]
MTTVPLNSASPTAPNVPDDVLRSSSPSQRLTLEPRQSRIARVHSLRRNRTSSHIKEFYRLNVSLASDINLEVTIGKEQTIEFLAKEIEAQCAFNSLEPGQDAGSGNQRLIVPIEQIYDSAGLALKFSDRVCDVLEFNETVYAISLGEDVKDFSTIGPLADTSRILGARSGQTSSDGLWSIFHNKIGIHAFVDFCMEEFTIENLLFYLDIEIFRSLSGEMRQLYGDYVYYTYIAVNSPLEINISAETRADIPLPAQGAEPCELQFDEAQEQAYAMLKNHSFLRFKQAKWPTVRQNDHYDRATFSESFFDVFQPNLEGISGILKTVLDARTTTSSYPPNLIAFPELESTLFKESILPQVLSRLLPNMNRTFVGYFDDENRKEWRNKHRKMRKEKKLSKFFGERPSTEQMQRQSIDRPKGEDSRQTLIDRRPSGLSVLSQMESAVEENRPSSLQRRKKLEKLETIFGDRLPIKQKRVQQIVTHGYTPTASTMQVEPTSADSDSLSEDDELIPAESTNDLDPERRRVLQRRTKKLSTMLGESLNERTISKTVAKSADPRAPEILDKRNSVTSVMSIASSPETPLPETAQPASHIVKLSHKRRLDKISALMGERIGVDDLQEAQATATPKDPRVAAARPLTQDEKKQFHKTAAKLERLLGQLPPSEDVIAYSALPRSAETSNSPSADVPDVRPSILSFSFFIDNAKVVVDIIESPTEQPPSPSSVGAPIKPMHRSRSFGAIDTLVRARMGSTISLVEPKEKESRRRRLNKLRKFFGEGVSVDALIKQQILAEIEEAMLDEERSDLTVVREDVGQLHKKSS